LENYDVEKAIRAVWTAAPTIAAAIPGGLHEPPVESSDIGEDVYATCVVTKDSRPNQRSSRGEIDYRRAKISIYGSSKEDIVDAMDAVDAKLNDWRTTHVPLTLSVGDWIRTERPDEMNTDIKRGEPRLGSQQTTYVGVLEYRIWISKNE
jgi:hypothetical protein